MRFPKPLGVVCTSELGWRTTRHRWEELLPLGFEDVRFFNPETFQKGRKLLGSRSLREMLNTRAAVRAAIASGAQHVLVATNTDAVLLPPRAEARYFIYMDASHYQMRWICAHKPPDFRMKMRVRKIRELAKAGHIFLCQSRLAAHGAEEYRATLDQIHIVPPPVNVSEFSPCRTRGSGPLRALFIGSRFVNKGGDVCLEACADPELQGVEWHFITRENPPAGTRAHFHNIPYPGTSEIVARMQGCDVLVSPTRADMSPLAAIESQACGLAVIIRNVGATSEIVEDGVSGRLLDRSDLASVREALLRYVRETALLREHGAAGRERAVRENSYEVHAELLRAVVASD